jgi:hypothetical protein
MLYLVLLIALAAAILSLLAVWAFRDEYLVYVAIYGRGGFLLERTGRRYEQIASWVMPAALVRYVARTTAPRLAALPARWRAATARHRPAPAAHRT